MGLGALLLLVEEQRRMLRLEVLVGERRRRMLSLVVLVQSSVVLVLSLVVQRSLVLGAGEWLGFGPGRR